MARYIAYKKPPPEIQDWFLKPYKQIKIPIYGHVKEIHALATARALTQTFNKYLRRHGADIYILNKKKVVTLKAFIHTLIKSFLDPTNQLFHEIVYQGHVQREPLAFIQKIFHTVCVKGKKVDDLNENIEIYTAVPNEFDIMKDKNQQPAFPLKVWAVLQHNGIKIKFKRPPREHS